MLIDCEDCAVRGLACGDCVVTVLLGTAPEGVVLDDVETQALAALADGGLIPHLQLVPERPQPTAARDEPGRSGARSRAG